MRDTKLHELNSRDPELNSPVVSSILVPTLTLLVENDVREYFAEKVYKTIIPRNVAIAEASSHGKPVLVYDTNCVGSKAYIELAKEVILKQ